MPNKHTLGKWAIHKNEFCQWIGNENGKAQIAKVFQPAGMTDETAQANAQLIAAAPELLEAIETLSAQMADLIGKVDDFLVDAIDSDVQAANAVIRKAKGEM